jgi:hypothetical protein
MWRLPARSESATCPVAHSTEFPGTYTWEQLINARYRYQKWTSNISCRPLDWISRYMHVRTNNRYLISMSVVNSQHVLPPLDWISRYLHVRTNNRYSISMSVVNPQHVLPPTRLDFQVLALHVRTNNWYSISMLVVNTQHVLPPSRLNFQVPGC